MRLPAPTAASHSVGEAGCSKRIFRQAILAAVTFGCATAQEPAPVSWARLLELEKEETTSLSAWLREKDPVIRHVRIRDKLPIGDHCSLVLAQASSEVDGKPSMRFLLAQVCGEANGLKFVLGFDSPPEGTSGRLEAPSKTAAYVHWFQDYGLYAWTYRYSLISGGAPTARTAFYRRFAVDQTTVLEGIPYFSGSYAVRPPRGAPGEELKTRLVLFLAAGEWRLEPEVAWRARHAHNSPVAAAKTSLPETLLRVLRPALKVSWPPEEQAVQVGSEVWLFVAKTPFADQKAASGIYVSDRGTISFHPVPVPDRSLYESLRGAPEAGSTWQAQTPLRLENSIGPFVWDGVRLWFANLFYDGEGISGVGALGSFDWQGRRYEMRYLPGIAPWSASAIYADQNAVWVGLMRQPEGAPYGGGVLRFDRRTGQTVTFPIYSHVNRIVACGDSLCFATSYGVYELNWDRRTLTHVRVEPCREGTPCVVVRPVALP